MLKSIKIVQNRQVRKTEKRIESQPSHKKQVVFMKHFAPLEQIQFLSMF